MISPKAIMAEVLDKSLPNTIEGYEYERIIHKAAEVLREVLEREFGRWLSR